MCGFAGFLGAADRGQSFLDAMGATLHHRGPDDAGIWKDEDAGIGLTFRRLAILDLTECGHQPMRSRSDRFVIVFNGEIYNHLDLRSEMAGPATSWRGHSDTETLLAGFDTWGIERTVRRTVGMFAFAVWDRQTRTLTLGRDRLGEKPLYYGWQGSTFLFGSDPAALKVHPAFEGRIDRSALSLMMRHNYIPAPLSIYEGIYKLLPGTLLEVSTDVRDRKPVPYWDAREIIATGQRHPFQGSADDAVVVLEEKLKAAVGSQLLSDVPLGAFLSGGIDSSTIVALMQQESRLPVRTFSIGFDEAEYNEAEYAKSVANHLGTDHTELYVTAGEARDVIPMLPAIYAEPFSDSSQIPTFLVSQLARRHVTVSLSGDGGDELFAGYNRYVMSNGMWDRIRRVPRPMRRLASSAMLQLSPRTWARLLSPAQRLLPARMARKNLAETVTRGAQVLGAHDSAELYRLLVSHWEDPAGMVVNGFEPETVITDPSRRPRVDGYVHEMMGTDLLTYLPDDILAKVDRAAMAVSLETRVPFLDHRVVEFAWSLPLSYKLRGGVSKWPLRQVLYRYVPKQIIDRPKMGFGVPIDRWLRGPLRDWAEDLLSENRLRNEGFFRPEPIRRKWMEHLSGARNWQYHLWDVLMFQAWLAAQKKAGFQGGHCR